MLHLQCHIGFDSISLARRGARVTGADFSPASLAKARELAERAGVEVEFVEADATALPPELRGRFDVVYSTMGVICWIEEIADWMRSVHAALRPGGRLATNVGTVEMLTATYAVLKRLASRVEVLLMNLSRGVEQLESLRFEAVNPTFLLRVQKASDDWVV